MLFLYFSLKIYHLKGGLIFMTAISNRQYHLIHCFYFKAHPIKYFTIKNHLNSMNFLFKESLSKSSFTINVL